MDSNTYDVLAIGLTAWTVVSACICILMDYFASMHILNMLKTARKPKTHRSLVYFYYTLFPFLLIVTAVSSLPLNAVCSVE